MSSDPGLAQTYARELEDIKAIPAQAAEREAIRARAVTVTDGLPPGTPPSLEALRAAAAQVLATLDLPASYMGFAMVACDNAFWASQFAAVPPDRRVLLLPRCLVSQDSCQGLWDGPQMTCAACGGCVIAGLSVEARALGYQVIVSEGTTAVVDILLDGTADAVLGVACLESLERSFERIADLGVPHQAIPLLTDGCRDTTADLELLREVLHSHAPGSSPGSTATLVPLLRETRAAFDDLSLERLLAAAGCDAPAVSRGPSSLPLTDALAREWLVRGGKRLRPFVTVSAYAVARYGREALAPGADLQALIPDAVRALAVAIEALHKASLVHDDLEDGDATRYGVATLHRTHGVPVAVNVGDFLVGLGYRLIGAQVPHLGAEAVADILAHLASAHLQLARGQGAELLWAPDQLATAQPIDALHIGALKTAPAFEAALFAGLRAGGAQVDGHLLRSFSARVGEAFQVANDLAEWDDPEGPSSRAAEGLAAARPTILRAFANQAGRADELVALHLAAAGGGDLPALVNQAATLYETCGARLKAETLYARLRGQALELAAALSDPHLGALLNFLVRNILRRRPVAGA